MAKKPETLFKEKVIAVLKTLPNTWFLKTQERSIRGIPDIILCIRGQFIAMELKKAREDEPDALQEYNLDKISRAGGAAFHVYPENWGEVSRVLIQVAAGKLTIRPTPEDVNKPEVETH